MDHMATGIDAIIMFYEILAVSTGKQGRVHQE